MHPHVGSLATMATHAHTQTMDGLHATSIWSAQSRTAQREPCSTSLSHWQYFLLSLSLALPRREPYARHTHTPMMSNVTQISAHGSVSGNPHRNADANTPMGFRLQLSIVSFDCTTVILASIWCCDCRRHCWAVRIHTLHGTLGDERSVCLFNVCVDFVAHGMVCPNV